MRMTPQPPPNEDQANTQGECDNPVCKRTILRFRGQNDLTCECGANYNCFGQRLRDDLHTRRNPSETSDEIGDLEGYEIAYAGDDY
jgi:hypothetical protein